MRPSPVLLLALVAGGFALLAVPLARLTGAERSWDGGPASGAGGSSLVGGSEEAAGDGALVPSWLRIRFVHAPMAVAVRQGSRVVAEFSVDEEAIDGRLERTGALDVVEGEPVEVLVEARWPAGTPVTALGLEVEPDGLETRRATLWVEDGAAEEIITFSWP